MEFLDRVEEQKRFRRFLNLNEGALACLYGRRRIGKSRLVEEVVASRGDVVTFVAERSEAALQRSRMARDISALIPGFSDVSYDSWSVLFDRWRREAFSSSTNCLTLSSARQTCRASSSELPTVCGRAARR